MTKLQLQGLKAEDVFTSDQVLLDTDSSGKVRDWAGKKVRNELLAAAYDEIDKTKAARLRDCGKFLRYRKYPDGTMQLDAMTSCRVRLCPICTWRRSLKIYAQMREILDVLSQESDFRYVMLTLTVRNCDGDGLVDTIDRMTSGWKNFTSLEPVKRVCKGWYRSLEIVHDVYPIITREMYYGDSDKHIKRRKPFYDAHGFKIGDPNPNYNTYHPHFHVLIAVSKSYFKSRDYLCQKAWAELWQQSLRADYEPRVDVRCVAGNTMNDINKAVCEVAKYACKDSDYIVPDDWDLTVGTVRLLDRALHNRRLVAFGGVLKDTKRRLKLDDVEDGDLVHVGDDMEVKEEEFIYVCYWWYSGYKQYYEIT